MSYYPEQQPAKPRRGGGGMFFLIAIAAIAFFMFSRGSAPSVEAPERDATYNRSAQQQREAEEDELRYQRQREEVFGKEATAEKKMPTTGRTGAAEGWSMDDVDSNSAPSTTATTTSSTENDEGWSIDTDLGPSTTEPDNKRTENDEWSFEEVDGKKK
jgi:hypothetical protein